MFTIQYTGANGESAMQTFDSKSRVKLASHLATFGHPILAVYEGSTPITKAVRLQLRHAIGLSPCARDFVNSPL